MCVNYPLAQSRHYFYVLIDRDDQNLSLGSWLVLEIIFLEANYIFFLRALIIICSNSCVMRDSGSFDVFQAKSKILMYFDD